MPNHIHAIVVPSDEDGLRRTLGDLHRRYTSYINARARRTGHLLQGRFGSVAVDEVHLHNALRYVSLNPVRARLVNAPPTGPGRACARILRALIVSAQSTLLGCTA